MNKRPSLGIWRHLVHIPRRLWRREVEHNAEHTQHRLDFMTADHHRVRDFVVLELPRSAAPIPPQVIAERMGLSMERVVQILDELERHMTFVFRNERDEVAWAYPITVEPTPHRVSFSSGEQVYAA